MAGGGDFHPVKTDPAIERWQAMQSSMYTRFRLTPTVTRKVLLWGALVPFLTYAAVKSQDDLWELRGKGLSDTLLRHPPPPPPAEEEE